MLCRTLVVRSAGGSVTQDAQGLGGRGAGLLRAGSRVEGELFGRQPAVSVRDHPQELLLQDMRDQHLRAAVRGTMLRGGL